MSLSSGRITGGSVRAERDLVFANSARVWLALVAFLVVVQLAILYVPMSGLQADPRIGFFSWPSIAGFGLAGLLGVWFASRTGFPRAWPAEIPYTRWLLLPALIGMGFGLLLIADELVYHWIAIFQTSSPMATFNTPFPGSLLIYPGGAIVVEVLYRLLPIPLLLWVISSLILRGRGQAPTFWVLAAITSLLEPLSQDLAYLSYGLVAVAASFGIDYGFNLTQAALFRRYGFLSAIVARWGLYLVWHVLYGNFVCNC